MLRDKFGLEQHGSEGREGCRHNCSVPFVGRRLAEAYLQLPWSRGTLCMVEELACLGERHMGSAQTCELWLSAMVPFEKESSLGGAAGVTN